MLVPGLLPEGGHGDTSARTLFHAKEGRPSLCLTAYAPYAVSPKYESTEHFFVVTLPNVKWTGEEADAAASEMSDKHDGVNVGENDGVKLSPTQKKVLEHLRENGALSAAELANAIGKTQRTVERALAELKAKGFLARVGSDKTGYWNVLK